MTTTPFATAPVEIRPEFVPVPRPGTRDPHTGLSRSYLCALLAEGKIESVSLRKAGNSRGKRLIRYASLINFINSEASKEAS